MRSVSKIIDEIRKEINRYHQVAGACSIDTLLDIQDAIAIRSFTLASHTADYKTSYNASYFMRKIGIAKSSLAHQKSGLKIATAEQQALIDNAAAYEQEQANEATAVQLDMLLRQTNVILSAIQQRISHMKKERELTYKQEQT